MILPPPVRRFLSALSSFVVGSIVLAGLALFAAVVVAGYTALTDPTDVTALARVEACGRDAGAVDCPWTEHEWSLLGRTLEFVTPKLESVRVHCGRQHVVLGDYVCEVRDRHPPSGASPAPSLRGHGPKGPGKPRAPSTASASPPASAMPPAAGDGGADRAPGGKPE